jgi:hypothetical protein
MNRLKSMLNVKSYEDPGQEYKLRQQRYERVDVIKSPFLIFFLGKQGAITHVDHYNG